MTGLGVGKSCLKKTQVLLGTTNILHIQIYKTYVDDISVTVSDAQNFSYFCTFKNNKVK